MALTEPASTRPAPARMPQQLLKLVADKSTSDRPEATSSDPGQVFRDFADYAINVSERSVLFWDTLRQRAENMMAHDRAGKPPLLDFDYEVVLDARRFERPTNYNLLRITRVGDTCLEDCLGSGKPPVVVFDPRAGHGPGIGGFKRGSEVGLAFDGLDRGRAQDPRCLGRARV